MKYHDELADLKSFFDGHLEDESFDDKSLGSHLTLYKPSIFP